MAPEILLEKLVQSNKQQKKKTFLPTAGCQSDAAFAMFTRPPLYALFVWLPERSLFRLHDTP